MIIKALRKLKSQPVYFSFKHEIYQSGNHINTAIVEQRLTLTYFFKDGESFRAKLIRISAEVQFAVPVLHALSHELSGAIVNGAVAGQFSKSSREGNLALVEQIFCMWTTVGSTADNTDFKEILATCHIREPYWDAVWSLAVCADCQFYLRPQGQCEGSQSRQDVMKLHVLEHVDLAT